MSRKRKDFQDHSPVQRSKKICFDNQEMLTFLQENKLLQTKDHLLNEDFCKWLVYLGYNTNLLKKLKLVDLQNILLEASKNW